MLGTNGFYGVVNIKNFNIILFDSKLSTKETQQINDYTVDMRNDAMDDNKILQLGIGLVL